MQRTRTAVSLGDLLNEGSFGLKLLTGGANALERPVLGAHTVEVKAPTRWLSEDWVMLTTGVRLRGSAAAQRELVRELEESGVSALGFGVGVVFKQVPPALVQEAEQREFPVIEVPYETQFREITRYIDSALGRSEEQVFRKLSALQRYLIDALRDPEPERTMLRRLAEFLDATVVIVTEGGEVESSTGKAPVKKLWREISTYPHSAREISADGWHAVAAPVAASPGRPARWLLIASRRPGFTDKLIKPAAETAAPLLGAMSGVEDLVRAQEEAMRAALLTEALGPLDPGEVPTVAARAASFGLDFSEPARIVVLRGDELDLDLVRRELARAGARHLIARRGDGWVALLQGVADLDQLLRGVAPESVIGIGRAATGVSELNHSLRDAELALDHVALEPGRRVLAFDDFDLATFAVSEASPERLAPKVEEILSVLRAQPALHEALLAYFRHDLDIVATAAALHLHPNSLRYRLSRIEKLLGRSLRQPATIASLYVALVAGS